MSRRMQPPGGSSSIFFGGEEPSSRSGANQAAADSAAASQADAQRFKDRNKGSSIVFGEETARESSVHNKERQTHRSYNLITGADEEHNEQPKSKDEKEPGSNELKDQPDAAQVAAAGVGSGGVTSIKVHHPPGGKSSGPLW